MRIGVLADPSSWHFLDLQRSVGNRHDLVSISYEDLLTCFGSSAASFRSSKTDLKTLDRLIVRTMPAGSLQQVVFRMDLLGRLAASGVLVVNPPKTIEIAVDKYLSLSLLDAAGVAVPPTAVAESLRGAMECFDGLGGDVVYKPIFGSMGRGVVRLTDERSAARFFETQIAAGQVIYLQQFIDHSDWDIRILLVGRQTFAIKRQRTGHWLTNIAQGATGRRYLPSLKEIGLCRRAAEITGCSIAGVDLFYDVKTGTPMVCDVNASPGWKATAETIDVDIAEAIIDEVTRGDR